MGDFALRRIMTEATSMTERETPLRTENEPETPQTSVFDGYITEAEYARQRGVSVRTCQRDRALRKAPPHVPYGNCVYYRIDAIRQWLEARERATSESARRRQAAGRRPRGAL